MRNVCLFALKIVIAKIIKTTTTTTTKSLSFLNDSERSEIHAHTREMIRKINENISIECSARNASCSSNDHSYGNLGVRSCQKNFASDLLEFEDEVDSISVQTMSDEVTKYINSSFQENYLVEEENKSIAGGIDLISIWKPKVSWSFCCGKTHTVHTSQ